MMQFEMNILPEEVVNSIQPEESLINKPFREVAEEEQRNNSQLPEEIVSLINNIKQNRLKIISKLLLMKFVNSSPLRRP